MTAEHQDYLRDCEERLAPRGSDLYYSLLYTPEPQCRTVILLHAYHDAMRRLLLNCRNPEVTQVKLQWWREQTAALYDGRPKHPLLQLLQQPVRRFALPHRQFTIMLDCIEKHLHTARLDTEETVYRYFAQTAGMCEQMSVTALGGNAPAPVIRNFAVGMAMTENMQRLAERLHCCAGFLPQSLLVCHGVDLSADKTILAAQLASLLREQARDIRTLLCDDRSLPAPLCARVRMARALLAKIERRRFDVLHRRIALTPLYKLWLTVGAQRDRRII